MTDLQRKEIEATLKPGQVAVDIRYTKTGTDESGLPIFKITYISPPQNFKLVRVIEAYRGAVLEDLDYVPPQTQTK